MWCHAEDMCIGCGGTKKTLRYLVAHWAWVVSLSNVRSSEEVSSMEMVELTVMKKGWRVGVEFRFALVFKEIMKYVSLYFHWAVEYLNLKCT